MPVRLKIAHLEAKPKQVIIAPTWRDPARLARIDEFAKAIDHIRVCIANGTPLPSTYYSKEAGKRIDHLLNIFGIMHLHLGRWTTNELLWLVQYPEHVVFLELSDHKPFTTRPPGVVLTSLHEQGLKRKEAELDTLAVERPRRMTYGERLRAGLVKTPEKPKT